MSGPYSRVYLSIVDDPRFAGIYEDDRHLATWLRLLLIAEAAWPASAHLPRSARSASVKALSDAGLIEVRGDLFRIHGLDPERQRRSEHARNAAARRHAPSNAASNAPSNAQTVLVRERVRERVTPLPPADEKRLDIEAFILVRRKIPTPAQRALMDRYQDVFDRTGPERAERLILSNPDDPIGALKADLDEFRRQRTEEAKASEVPKPKPRRSPGLPEASKELLAHWAAQREEAS